jgi:hypothetical protein
MTTEKQNLEHLSNFTDFPNEMLMTPERVEAIGKEILKRTEYIRSDEFIQAMNDFERLIYQNYISR